MSTVTSASPSQPFRVIRTPTPRLHPSAHARTPVSMPQTADAGTQYTPEGFPPTATSIAGSKRRGSSPTPPSMTSQSQSQPLAQAPTDSTTLPERPANQQAAAAIPQGTKDVSDSSPSAAKRPRTHEDPHLKIMPLKYETCDPKDLGYLISNMLMELIRLNDKLPLSGRLTRFHSRIPPAISCHDYLQRIIQHATLSPPILLSIVYYIDRLCALYPAFTISSLTVHRFLITAATVAAKGLSDSFWTNPTYARIGGISISELATLEMEFLEKTQWRIVPKPEVLVDYYVSLVQRSEGYHLETQPIETDPT